ncbi:hypothetical protein T265_05480 [Opisthorchis viverrini]|uniref:Coiled-coil domain-containing protein 146 n=2 Tax=Opisthorchis viverrini TaxID=6198 RepID=A0A074ZJJ7_OPIVI|nr:hypothetical protein T265_05480 [Opisthorchis viverrini]KER27523.1 hypothetical protein T265_05480 [Opisthorchis viverrini]
MNQSPDPQDQLLVARPTDEASVLRIESQTEVASSVAFQAIDDQFHAGKLTSTEVAVYKARYMKVHEALKRTRENEFSLIQLSKRYMAEIEEQEQQLIKADQFPDNTITEPAQMRAQILNYYNSAMETDERVEMLQYEAGLLREERKLLNRDYSRLPMAELEALSDDVDIFTEMERRMKTVQNQCQDLWLEIDMLKMEAKRSREQFRQASDMEHEAQSDLSNLGQRMNDVKAEWVIATDLPGQYSKEAEKARKYKSNAEKELQNLQQEFTELSETLSNLELQLNDLEAEELSNHEARYLQRLHVAEQDRRDIAEETTKLARERDAYIRHCKKLQTQVEVLKDNVKLVEQLYDKARARYIVTPRYDGEMLQRKRRLARAIGHLQQELEDEHKHTATEVAHLSRTVGASERRLALMEYLRAENWELIRLTTTLTEGLGKAIFEYTNARNKHERLLEDLEEKNREMQEHQKALDELGSRLADVSAMYTKMKLERNKCVSLLQASVKLALDTRERLRIHMNEAEIIIFRLQRQDQELFRERSLYQSSVVQRDHKRNELCKLLHLHAEQNSRREQMRRSIYRINSMFNQTEAETLGVKKAKERSAQIRNERALLLIERNQEVYILQERILAQDAAARAGQLTLLSIQEEYEFLKRYRNDLARHVDLVRRMLPTHNKLSAELQGLIHQLVGSRMELNRLVELAEDPDVPGRLRLLGGKDPSQHELWITLGRLERRMAAKEEDMAEKNLTYEAVCRLVDSLQVRVAAGKDDTLTLATEVNKVKDRLLQLKNYIKTMYAELVVCGAERNTLKKQVLMLEQKLDIYNLRMRYGQPPSPTMEQKWQTNVRIRKHRGTEKPKIKPMRPSGTLPNTSTAAYGRKKKDPVLVWQPIEETRQSRHLSQNNENSKLPGVTKSNGGTSGGRTRSLKRSIENIHLPPIDQTETTTDLNSSIKSLSENLNNAIDIRPIGRGLVPYVKHYLSEARQTHPTHYRPKWKEPTNQDEGEGNADPTTPPLSLAEPNEDNQGSRSADDEKEAWF